MNLYLKARLTWSAFIKGLFRSLLKAVSISSRLQWARRDFYFPQLQKSKIMRGFRSTPRDQARDFWLNLEKCHTEEPLELNKATVWQKSLITFEIVQVMSYPLISRWEFEDEECQMQSHIIPCRLIHLPLTQWMRVISPNNKVKEKAM